MEIDAEHITQFAHNGYVYCMLLAKDTYLEGQAEILISGGGDGTIKLWMLEGSDSNRIHEIVKLDDGRDEGDPVLTIALDGNFLYSGRADGEINVWDLETKQLVRITKAHDGDILTMALGRALLFTAAVTGDVKVRHGAPDLVKVTNFHVAVQSTVRMCQRLASSSWHGACICVDYP